MSTQATTKMVRRYGIAMVMATMATISMAAPKSQPQSDDQEGYLPHLKWTDLVPKGWDPADEIRKRNKNQNIATLRDNDPRMIEMLKQMRDVWDTAPVNPEMDGVKGRLPGYVVPLEESAKGMTEFLLVPYFGACIHTPPPPANQIVHVYMAKPVKGLHSMDTVWVIGTLTAAHADSYMGASGYKIESAKVQNYEPASPQH
ncbi:MAG: DUF3299 domain-containing protein [Aquabacterium sp.]